MSKIDDFYKNLLDIYGSEITDTLIEKKSKSNVISFTKDRIGLTKYLIEYYLDLEKKKPSQIKSCDLRIIFCID